MTITGMVPLPLAKDDTLVRNGTVISDVYFFGESPPVYPSPLGNGTGDWADAYASAKALVAEMTMDEKVCCSESSPFVRGLMLCRSVSQVELWKEPAVMETSLQYHE
jgi:hypothetical protein